MTNHTALSWLSNALNAYLRLNPEARTQQTALAGKAITMHLLPFHLMFQLVFQHHEVKVVRGESQTADACITGTPAQLLRAACDKSRRPGDLVLEGDATLLSAALDLFAASRIDWEEQAAQLIGDVPAHYAGRLMQRIRQAAGAADRSFTTSMDEYLHEEVRLFPNRERVEDFLTEVDELREAVDRVEAKINQLHLEE